MRVSLPVSRFRVVLAAVCAAGAALLTSACGAGQIAATAQEKPSLDGTYGRVGNIRIEGVAFRTPSGPSYATGASVPLIAYIVNNGESADKLVKVSSPAFTGGWNVVSTPSLLAGPSGAPSPTAASQPTNGQPQTIGAGSAVGFGLENLSPSGAGSPESLVLLGYKGPNPLFPGTTEKVTFTFANAGQTTLTVPVQIGSAPSGQTVPEISGSPAA
jgi:copper(I)-binding protein